MHEPHIDGEVRSLTVPTDCEIIANLPIYSVALPLRI